jgi:hypothetical protein
MFGLNIASISHSSLARVDDFANLHAADHFAFRREVGPEWRALARGRRGWHPVADLPSEADAIEAALAAQRDSECRLHAIGNFRVADDK